MKKSEAKQIAEALDWLKAALECKNWVWGSDQRELAEIALSESTAVLSGYYDPPKRNAEGDEK